MSVCDSWKGNIKLIKPTQGDSNKHLITWYSSRLICLHVNHLISTSNNMTTYWFLIVITTNAQDQTELSPTLTNDLTIYSSSSTSSSTFWTPLKPLSPIDQSLPEPLAGKIPSAMPLLPVWPWQKDTSDLLARMRVLAWPNTFAKLTTSVPETLVQVLCSAILEGTFPSLLTDRSMI